MKAPGSVICTALLTACLGERASAEAVQDDKARISALEAQVRRLSMQVETLTRMRSGAPFDAAPSGASLNLKSADAPPSSGVKPPSTAASLPPPKPSTEAAHSAEKSVSPRVFGPNIPTTGAVASIDAGRPVIQTPDGRFTVNLLAVMHFDVADYFQAAARLPSIDLRRGGSASDTAHARDLSSGSDFRRARLGLGGRAFNTFEYSFLYDFGGAGEEDAGHIQELWLQYSGLKPFHFRAGAFSPFQGLDDAGSTNGMLFLERAASADIARSLAGGDFREAGQVTANTDRWFASAAVTGRVVGVVSATGTGVVQPYDSQLGAVGRVAFLPVRRGDALVHLGAHGSYVASPADVGGPNVTAGVARYPIELRERPELRVDGTRLIDTGAINARHANSEGLEFAFQKGPFLVQSEIDRYAIDRGTTGVRDPSFGGFYVEAAYSLTGEPRRYNTGNFAFDAPRPQHDFDLATGGWGAFETAVRFSEANLNFHAGRVGSAPAPDAVRGGDQRIVSAGLNWYLNPIMRVMFDYQNVQIDRLSPSATSFVTPAGAQVGQTYSVGDMRLQLAF